MPDNLSSMEQNLPVSPVADPTVDLRRTIASLQRSPVIQVSQMLTAQRQQMTASPAQIAARAALDAQRVAASARVNALFEAQRVAASARMDALFEAYRVESRAQTSALIQAHREDITAGISKLVQATGINNLVQAQWETARTGLVAVAEAQQAWMADLVVHTRAGLADAIGAQLVQARAGITHLVAAQRMRIADPFNLEALASKWVSSLRIRLTDLFRTWGVPDIVVKLSRFANGCYFAVLALRNVVRDGDPEPLRAFLHDHLGFSYGQITEDQVQALVVTLLEDRWYEGLNFFDDAKVKARLRKHVRYGNDLVGDHQIQGRRIGYLPIGPLGEAVELRSLTTATAEEVALARIEPVEDQRIARVLERLKPADRAIAMGHAYDVAETWEQVAICSGQEPKRGESVRRKLHREGKVLNERGQGHRRDRA